MNILITGITGFFGRNFVKYLIDNKIVCTIVGTAHSECKLAYFKKLYPTIKTFIVDLANDKLEVEVDVIIRNYNINYIIHAAAMKHVDICQEHPILALRVNTIATNVLLNLAKKYNLKNFIALSTDKTNNPCNTYGIAKFIMQENVLSHGYSVYQGANFFWSDGSVLDVWFNQYIKNQKLTIRNYNHVRYFNTIDHVCHKIFENIDKKNMIILPDHVYVINIGELFDEFRKYFSYENYEKIEEYNYEKTIEILKDEISNKIVLDRQGIVEKIDRYYKNMI